MNTGAILFFILFGFYIGLFAGILLMYAIKKWKQDERILVKDVDKWMKNNNGN